MAITLHWLNNSRAQRIVWMLEELGLDYKIVTYLRDPKTMLADPALKKVHPLGKSPVIELEDGTVLAESGLILDELVRRYGKDSEIAAKSVQEDLDVRHALHHAEGSLQPDLLLLLITSVTRKQSPFLARPLVSFITSQQDNGYANQDLLKELTFLEGLLKKNSSTASPWGYFAGDHLTAADIIYSYPLENAQSMSLVPSAKYPQITKWLEYIQTRPAYKKAFEKVPANKPLM